MNGLPFGKRNYALMLTGIGVLILGFLLMAMDGEPFGFGTLGLFVGPVVVMLGFGIEFFAILHKPRAGE